MLELYIILLVVIQLLLKEPASLGVSNECLLKCFTYPLAHANLVHLIMNSVALLLMARPIWNMYNRLFGHIYFSKFFFICYIGAVIAGLFCAKDVPTVGSSGICFFLLGCLLGLRPTVRQVLSMWTVFACIVIQLILGHSNVSLHVAAFVLGVVFIIIRKAYESTRIK